MTILLVQCYELEIFRQRCEDLQSVVYVAAKDTFLVSYGNESIPPRPCLPPLSSPLEPDLDPASTQMSATALAFIPTPLPPLPHPKSFPVFPLSLSDLSTLPVHRSFSLRFL